MLFLGTVRNHARGEAVTGINYEAYGPMAEKQLEKIADELSLTHKARVAIVHRHGELVVGDTAVAIAASSPHREAAFEACRAAIERIKTDVPIWKREQAASGEVWVGWGGG